MPEDPGCRDVRTRPTLYVMVGLPGAGKKRSRVRSGGRRVGVSGGGVGLAGSVAG